MISKLKLSQSADLSKFNAISYVPRWIFYIYLIVNNKAIFYLGVIETPMIEWQLLNCKKGSIKTHLLHE